MRLLGSGRLVFRIYAACVALILAFIAVFMVVAPLIERPPSPPPGRAARIARELARAQEAGTLQTVTDELRQEFGDRISIYETDGKLLATNVSPPLTPPEGVDRRRIGDSPPTDCRPGSCTFVMAVGPNAYAVVTPDLPDMNPWPLVLTAAAIMLVLASVAAVLVARGLGRPLSELAGAARALGTGDTSARIRSPRNDEFGEVARAFDEMADRVTELLTSQTQLLANVSHELRTPLSRIRVALDLAAEGDSDLARQSLADIAEDMAELEGLVSDVLTLARFDLAPGKATAAQLPLRLEVLDLNVLIEKSSARFRALHPGRALTVSLNGASHSISADPATLHRALDNLLDNACKYSDVKTPVTLSVGVDAKELKFVVADQGVGMDATELAQLFTPFFRSDKSRARMTGGVGLGLALSRRIIEAHGGRVEVQSEPARGTTVTFWLPALIP